MKRLLLSFLIMSTTIRAQEIILLNFSSTAYSLKTKNGVHQKTIATVGPFESSSHKYAPELITNLVTVPNTTIEDALVQERSVQITQTNNNPLIFALEQKDSILTQIQRLDQPTHQAVIIVRNNTHEQLLLRVEVPVTNTLKDKITGFSLRNLFDFNSKKKINEKVITTLQYPIFLYYTIPAQTTVTLTRPDLEVNPQENLDGAHLQNLNCLLKIISSNNTSKPSIEPSFGFKENDTIHFDQTVVTELDQGTETNLVNEKATNLITHPIDTQGKILKQELLFTLKPKEAYNIALFNIDYGIQGDRKTVYQTNKKKIKVEKIAIP